MKHYYYSENNQQLGPFTFDELATKRLKKSTLVWTDGMIDWKIASELDELQDILISEPPPLPSRQYIESNSSVNIKVLPSSTLKTANYKKETEATVFGILILLAPVFWKVTGIFSYEDEASYNKFILIFSLVSLIVRICVTIWIVEIAKRQNRNDTGWGWFAFLLPSIALIIIGLLNKLPLNIILDDSLSNEEQINVLKLKANELKEEGRYEDALVLFRKIKAMNSNTPEIEIEIKKCKDRIEIFQENSVKKMLTNGQIIEFKKPFNSYVYSDIKVLIDGIIPADCIVRLKDEDMRYEIKNGKSVAEYYVDKYQQKDGAALELDDNRVNSTTEGRRAWINNLPAPDGKYRIDFLFTVKVKDGKVVRG